MPSDKKIATTLDNRFVFAKQEQDPIFADFARYRALWKSKIVDSTNYPWDYSLFNPMTFSTVRSIVARIASGNVGVTLQAWNEKAAPKTETNQALLDWEFSEVDLFLKTARAIHQAAMYGKGFLQTGWLFKKAKVIEDENGRQVPIAPMVNRADLANVRPYDVFIANRNIPELQGQPWSIIRHWRTIQEMERINEERGEEVYRYLNKLKDKNLFVRFVDYGRDVMFQDNSDITPFKNGLLETLEMYDQDTGRVYEMIRGHREWLLRDEENPYWHGQIPLIDLTFFPEDDEFWSTGIVRPAEDLQMALNSVLNQYLTNARQQLNPMWMTGDLQVPDWEFISRPNGVIHAVGDIQQLKEIKHSDITNQSMEMMDKMENMIQRTTGVTDLLAMGEPPAGGGKRNTAALQLEENNLDTNLKLFMTLFEQKTLQAVARQFLALNAQYITSDQTIKISGRHGYKHVNIKPDEVSAEFDPVVIPNSTQPKNSTIRFQNLSNLKAMADKEQKVNVNTAPIWKEMVSVMGLTDLDEIIPDDKEEALEENDLIKKGEPVEVEPDDNHKIHIPIHQFDLINPEAKLTPQQTERLIKHINEHKMWDLAQDPQLIEKLTGQPGPGAALQGPQQPPTAPQGPLQPQPGQPPAPGGVPFPNAAVNQQGLVRQQGQLARQMVTPPSNGLPLKNVGGRGG